MPKVLIPLASGFEEIEAVTIVDILRRADVEVVMGALEGLHVKGAHGIMLQADALLSELNEEDFEMIVLPGGLPGAFHLAEHQGLLRMIQSFNAKAKSIAAICAAPLVLKAAGVLKEHYTCYPSFEEKIAHPGYVKESKIVRDKNITTSQGPSTAMVFALELVEQLCSKEKKEALQKDLLL